MSSQSTIQPYLSALCDRVAGLQTIIVTDRDGVVILRAPEQAIDDHRNEQIMTTIFSLTTDQTSKIKALGQANHILTFYDTCICLQANHLPLVITLKASLTANPGELLDLLPDLKKALDITRSTILRETDKF
mmetsp:Transcript_45150/g.97993  ORF Transcript_45150/g.97993 Transcript_45150/m.97993 type:complete len:132 (+) Transcript_45150:40-435(+)